MKKILFAVVFTLIFAAGAYANPLNTFAGQSGSIPLSQLDTNFQTVDCGKYNVNQASVDQGVNDGLGSLANLLATISTNPATVCLTTPGNYTMATSTTIPANVTLVVKRGAILLKSGTPTLTITGTLEAGLYQIFSGWTTGVTFSGGSVKEARQEWFGTALGVTSVTGAYTILNTDRVIEANGTFNLSVGAIGTYVPLQTVVVKNIGTGTITLNFTVDGSASVPLAAQYDSVTIFSDGTQWRKLKDVGSMTYPGAGVPKSTGSAWDTSYTVGTAASNLVQLNASAQLPAVSGVNLTALPATTCTTGAVCTGYQAALTNPVTGTGINYYLPVWSSGSAITTLASVGTAGQVLTSAGASAKPIWATPTALAGFIPYTGATSDVNLGTHTLTAAGITVTGYVKFDTTLYNTFLGQAAGNAITSGGYNNFIGFYSGYSTTSGANNNFMGETAGASNTTGDHNVYLGEAAGYTGTTANNNVYIGTSAGAENVTGHHNIFIGPMAGFFETGSNTLFIDNAQRASEADARLKALIYGIFASTTAGQSLTVNGTLKPINIQVLNGKISTNGTAPTISTCGGGTPAAAAGSSRTAGKITLGSGSPTACTLTWATAFTNTPACTITPNFNATAYISAESESAMTVTFSAGAATSGFNYHCIGLGE